MDILCNFCEITFCSLIYSDLGLLLLLKLVMCAQSLSHVQLCDLSNYSCQAPLFMGFPRQEHWIGLPFLPLGDFPNPEIEPMSSALTGRFFATEPLGKPHSDLGQDAKVLSKLVEQYTFH